MTSLRQLSRRGKPLSRRYRWPEPVRVATGNSNSAILSVRRRRGSDFVAFPFEKRARPRLSVPRRRLRLLMFVSSGLATALCYGVFLVRCFQHGRVLSTAADAVVDWVCIGCLAGAVCLTVLCLLLQLMDNRRHPSGPGGCCCSCCGARVNRSGASEDASDSLERNAAVQQA